MTTQSLTNELEQEFASWANESGNPSWIFGAVVADIMGAITFVALLFVEPLRLVAGLSAAAFLMVVAGRLLVMERKAAKMRMLARRWIARRTPSAPVPSP